MLPGVDGLEVMRRLREQDSDRIAVILLTAKGEESDRVIGLRLGADDYVVKPFSPPSWSRASTRSCVASTPPPRPSPSLTSPT